TAARLTALEQALPDSTTLGGMELVTSLPSVLRGISQELAVARSLLVISAVQLLLLAAAALLATARLLASQREGELALLAARGATRWQLTWLTAAEVIPLSLLAALPGGVAGAWLATVLADSGPLGDSGIRLPGLHASGPDALAAAFVVAVCAIGALLAPTLGAGSGSPRPGTALVRRGRQATMAGLTRAGADLALVLLAVAAGWELRRYSAVSNIAGTGGASGIDPVLALAPALALVGGTVVMLRLLPTAARVTDRLAARGRGLTSALAGWQFSRQPLRSGGAALLIVMAVATGTLALAQHDSWARSVSDQAAFSAGANTRLDLPVPLPVGQAGIITADESGAGAGATAMAVSTQSQALPSVLAIQSGHGAAVALLRGDEAASPAALFHRITPAGPPGTVLPGHPADVELTATLTAHAVESAGVAPPGVTVTWPTMPEVTLTVLDASGIAYQLPAGTLPADGHPHLLTVRLGGDHASFPLRLISINIAYPMPGNSGQRGTLVIAGPSLAGWTPNASSTDLTNLGSAGGTFAGSAQPTETGLRTTGAADAGPGTATLTFTTGYGRGLARSATGPSPEPLTGLIQLTAAAPGQPPLPVIATQAYLNSTNQRVGGIATAALDGVEVPVRIVASVVRFPTITGSALIVDLSALGEYLAASGAPPLPVTQWWLSAPATSAPATPAPSTSPPLTSALPPGTTVTTVAGLRAQLASEPLMAAPQQALLALAAAAGLLAITGFCVSIATGVRARRGENALLAALGVTQRAAAAQLCVEKLLLSVASAALGLV
ncbi:MAG TPA: ABC transporter permease, partial [Streptosporangiaceae bacterium]|nr:ABC transporter permease [Streptosporangiaceae bacterium]